jgi:phosphoesterase RecJ-like protein
VLKEISQVLSKNNTFLIATHLHPDGDAIGSLIVFLGLMEDLGKEARALSESPVPALYRFLPGSQKISTKLDKNFKPEVAVVLDTPTLDRLGRIKEYVAKAPFIINIDHHISNARFGNINWVIDSSAVAEMIMALLQYLKVEITPDWAICLYTAILTDTGSFRYINTTSKTHRIAATLIEKGVRPAEIAQNVYETNTPQKMQFIARVLKNLKVSSNGEIAWVTVPPYQKYENDEEIVTYPRSLESVRIAILFRELKGNKVKISFRSKGGVDVNTLAQKFGGGGHPAASGCVVKGALPYVRRKILEEAESFLK